MQHRIHRGLERIVAVALLSVALLFAACSKPKPNATSGPAKRVVSLSPSTTEALFAVGAGAAMVGRSRYCDFPPEVAKLPQVGGYVDPSFEAILALQPDLVVGARGPAGSAIAEKLEARGIATYFPETESFAAIDAMILGAAERTGRAEAAKAAVERIHRRIAAVERAVSSSPRTRVLVVFGLEPLSVAGPSSFSNEMIERAGGTNVISEGGAYPTIGVERVLALDPDVIVNAAMMEERASERLRKDAPGWSRVRAVQQDRVATIADESVLRPGPRVADGLTLLARALHPEAAIELDASADGGAR
ncbi:MAG: ABC transporter substrate-binding protein [Labilithrix sp.]|nr:ABC transporter substrate-binding protein [Labilithrix sp.]